MLVRTAHNLQNPNLGFSPDRLLVARVTLGPIAEDVSRRDRVLRELHAGIDAIPGVEATSFSQLGLFSGGVSTSMIVVEGSALTGERGREAALDRVGAGYFAALGIPVRLGRDIAESDRADSHKVCVINEAFAERYFSGRDPLGMHVATLDDRGGRTAYEVVGVVGNARTQSLRGEIEPRFYVPGEQRASAATNRTFMIRIGSAETAAIAAAVRDVATVADAGVSVYEITSFDEQLAGLTAEDRAVAQLAVVFGAVALGLTALGLYGVLSYHVSRRSSEIAIRIALGARSRRVVQMILAETVGLVAAGLVAGGALSYLGSRFVATRLYGVAPQDPPTLTSAVVVLLLAAFVAAYLPARRASRVNPITVLHQG